MPCNIGFKSYAKAEIPAPQPQEFSVKSEAPEIDADLLEKLGIEDSTFLEWAKSLDTRPLLEEALKRTLSKLKADGVRFKVNDRGMLEASGSFTSAAQKRRLADQTTTVTDQWQFEILAIVTELLDYTPTITKNGNEMVLVAEEAGKSHPCDYIKVTKKGGDGSICFEHFKSRKALDLATAKFLMLAHKLGVKVAIGRREISEGDPLPSNIWHTHGHSHAGHYHEH
jgi:hypothetical protein